MQAKIYYSKEVAKKLFEAYADNIKGKDVDSELFRRRLNRGWSELKAISTDKKSGRVRGKQRKFPDEFYHYMEIAKANGIEEIRFRQRVVRDKMDYQTASTLPVREFKKKSEEFHEHLKIAEKNEINRNTFYSRNNMNWSLSESCVKPARKITKNTSKIKDNKDEIILKRIEHGLPIPKKYHDYIKQNPEKFKKIIGA